jgi:hypothetical protein
MTTKNDAKILAERTKKFMIAPSEFANMQHTNIIRLITMKKEKLIRWDNNRGIFAKY